MIGDFHGHAYYYSFPCIACSHPLDDARAKYEALYNSLDDAYYSGKDVKAKTEIQKQKNAVHEILTAITKAQLDKDTAQLSALKDTVKATNDDLAKLKDEIGKIVKDIQIAGEVEVAIGTVLGLAGLFL